ncbi:hypothetical protein [Actinacidiphila sp. ITFR-21]|uniref:hypothetical protein n=1 Tax=Actinacidiphila sp. ITFR-21 TaxID=3075199 RepID=UPI002889EE23|nr:hypothetical protein [Streptomyces sp. ITFR-21]WNI14413.1 hypothetical protein RLT57_01900 [Streptomyces sp. ITFR-21]
MSPGEVVLALLRRWYVLVFALLLTVAGAYHVLRPPQEYLSTAVIVVKPPATGNQPNQLANLQPPVAAVSYAVIEQLRSPAGTAELAAAGVRERYALIPRNSGTSVTPAYLIPSLQVQARQREAATADTAAYTVISVYRHHLAALQTAQHVPADAQMTAELLVPPNSVLESGTRSRALAGVALGGGVGGVLAALWTDRWFRRRSPLYARPRPPASAAPAAG